MPYPRVTQLNPPPELIDLGIGQPGIDMLPLELLREAAGRALAREEREFLNYGYEQGDGYLRRALADFLRAQAGYEVRPKWLMITGGASQALDLICTHFARSGDTVLVEEPTYFLALRIFAERGLKVVAAPTGPEGLDLDRLEDVLKRERPAFLYTVPTFQNPSGVTLSQERRADLVQLAREYDFFVVADEVYHLLNYGPTPPPPLAHYAGSERVMSLGSFSKILAPGLRLGWLQAAPSLLRTVTGSGLLDSGGGLNPFTSHVVRVVLEEERLAPHIAWLQEVYARRAALMDEALKTHLGDQVHYRAPQGGFFFWVRLPQDVDARELLGEAQEQGVAYQPGSNFSTSGGCAHYARLCFTYYGEEQIEEGVARLGRVIKK